MLPSKQHFLIWHKPNQSINNGNGFHNSFLCLVSLSYLSLKGFSLILYPCFCDCISINFIMIFNFRKRRDKSIDCSHNSMGTAQKLSCYSAGADFSYCHEAWLHSCCIQYVQSLTFFQLFLFKFSISLCIHSIKSCFKLLIHMLLEGIHLFCLFRCLWIWYH